MDGFFKKNLNYGIFVLVFITVTSIVCSSCKKSNTQVVDKREQFFKTNDSLDAISRDTIWYKVGNSNKKLKLAWSRNSSSLQIKVITELLAQMIYVEGGFFKMGCMEQTDTLCTEYEKPVQTVKLSSFFIAQYEVTQLLYLELVGNNPNSFKNNNFPVANVSWDDAQEFIKKLNHLTNLHFALPTEAQWEYAAKGGNKSKNTIFAGHKEIKKVAWYKENSNGMYHGVGNLLPNELNIYDMNGNVWEWCADYYAPYTPENKENPTGPATGTTRVYRGGSWLDNQTYSRITYRNSGNQSQKMNCLGFRVVLIP